MILIIQIKSLAFSFIYGIFFAFTYKINRKYLINNYLFLKIIINMLFILDHVLCYFILISNINNGILHIYFLFLFILGIIFYVYLFDSRLLNKIDLKNMKWYTQNIDKGNNMKKGKIKAKIFLVTIIFLSIGFILIKSIFETSVQIYAKQQEKKEFNAMLKKLKDKEDELNNTVTKLQNPDYVARYAREKYLYSKDGEIIIRIPE